MTTEQPLKPAPDPALGAGQPFDPDSTLAFQRKMEYAPHLRDVMRSASSVSPYLFVWVIPGSMLILPFMAWFLDRQRKRRERRLQRP